MITLSLHDETHIALRNCYAERDAIKALAGPPDVRWCAVPRPRHCMGGASTISRPCTPPRRILMPPPSTWLMCSAHCCTSPPL